MDDAVTRSQPVQAMWLPWRSKWWRGKPKAVRVSRRPEPEIVRISSTPDLSEVPFDEPDPHAPDIPDSRDSFLYLDFGFDGRIPVGIDLAFPAGPGADSEEILSHSQALLEAGLAFAARQLLDQLAEPAASSAKARWLRALLLWRRYCHAAERDRRGWGADFLRAFWPLWLQDAEKMLQDAVAKDPGCGPAWLSLAQLHLEPKGGAEPLQAVDEARRACRLLGGTPAALLTLGRALQAAGRPGDAIAAFDGIPQEADEYAAAKRESALARLEVRCIKQPIDVAAHSRLGRRCLRNNRLDRAREIFARLVELRPDRPEGFWGLGRLALIEAGKTREERLAEARRLALAALSRDPRFGLAHELLGMVHHNLEFFPRGLGLAREDPIPHFRRAAELQPSCDEALVRLAEDHVERDEIEQAITRLEKAVRLETRSAFAYRLLALLYESTRRSDRYDRIVLFRRKANDLEPRTKLIPTYVQKVRRLCNFEP